MRKDCDKLFNYSELADPPEGLLNKIMARIKEEKRVIAKRKYIFFSAAAIASFGTFISFVNFFWQEFIRSGVFQFFAFIFSDFNAILTNWQDFGLALLESFPTVSLIYFLSTLFIFLWSIKNMVDIKYQITNKII